MNIKANLGYKLAGKAVSSTFGDIPNKNSNSGMHATQVFETPDKGGNQMRYKIVEGSQSGHCCFEYTIEDTTKPNIIGGKQWVKDDGSLEFESVCECFIKEDAETICNALNGVIK